MSDSLKLFIFNHFFLTDLIVKYDIFTIRLNQLEVTS